MDDMPVIRPACEDDCPRLGELKFNYVHHIYASITPQSVLDATSQAACEKRVRELLKDETVDVTVIEQQGRIIGFAAYGPDPECEGWGLLYDTLYMERHDMDLHHALLRHIVSRMAVQGMERVHLWTLRNHYRSRYLYELFGFRTDGTHRSFTVEGDTHQLIRYQYPTL